MDDFDNFCLFALGIPSFCAVLHLDLIPVFFRHYTPAPSAFRALSDADHCASVLESGMGSASFDRSAGCGSDVFVRSGLSACAVPSIGGLS